MTGTLLRRRVWAWATMPSRTPEVRDLVALAAIWQGIIRMTPAPGAAQTVGLLPTEFYGILLIGTGLALLATAHVWSWRGRWQGKLVSSCAAALWALLGLDVALRLALASSGVALLFAWAMLLEARYDDC